MKQDGISKQFLRSIWKRSVMSAQMLEVSLLGGVGTVLRLEGCVVNGQTTKRQATDEYARLRWDASTSNSMACAYNETRFQLQRLWY